MGSVDRGDQGVTILFINERIWISIVNISYNMYAGIPLNMNVDNVQVGARVKTKVRNGEVGSGGSLFRRLKTYMYSTWAICTCMMIAARVPCMTYPNVYRPEE